MPSPRPVHFCFVLLILLFPQCYGQLKIFDIKNQLSSSASLNLAEPVSYNGGIRYLPAISLTGAMPNDTKIDAGISVNTSAYYFYTGNDFDKKQREINPYRFWIRYSSPRFELRAGLQKISFGPASIFRPLMWFDKLDYRDPLQLTEGVYALLGRYYTQNNINLWLWILYGNDETRGWDIAPTLEKQAEYGGRLQMPVLSGELAVNYHLRKADYSMFYSPGSLVYDPYFDVQLFGADGKWDIGPGIWFEYTFKRHEANNVLFPDDEQFITLGTDYTFNTGNGLTLITEYFRYRNNTGLNNYSSLAVSYPFGLMNKLLVAFYYGHENNELYRFVNLRRDYDYLSINLMAYWNPDNESLYFTGSNNNTMAGKGIQLMAIVNF